MTDVKADFSHHEIGTGPDHVQLLEAGMQIYESERAMTLWQSVKEHKRIVLYCLAGLLTGAIMGYDSIANGASLAMPAFLMYFGSVTPDGELYLPTVWTSLWSAMSGLAQVIGGFGIGFVIDRFGRKWVAVAMGFVSLGGVAAQFWATTSGELLVGKLINGIAMGALFTIGTSWASEISPPRLRAPIQSAIILFQVMTQMIGLGVIRSLVLNVDPSSFRIAFAVQWPLAVLVIITFIFVPESPVYLINRGRIADARKSMVKLYGKDNSIEARTTHLLEIIQHENLGKTIEAGGYIECFRGSNLRRTLTVIYVLAGVQVCGAQLLTQNIYFLIIAGLPVVHVFDVGIGGFAVAMILIALSWTFLDRSGRRILYLSGPAASAVLMFLIGGLYYVPGLAPIWVIAVIMNLLIAYGSLAFISVGWALTAELSSYKLRGKTQAIGVISNAFFSWLFSFVTPYMYNVDSGNLGARTGFIYGAIATLFFIAGIWIVPETKGLSVAEVDYMYENHIPSRKFQASREQARAAIVDALEEEVKKEFV